MRPAGGVLVIVDIDPTDGRSAGLRPTACRTRSSDRPRSLKQSMHTRELSIGSQTLSFETGKLAKQADGSVIVRFGDSVVLVTACHAANPREGIDFLPLTVDYREYTYASGRIPGGFFKREGKPAEKEVLTSRLIDRPIRPLFPTGWRYETQIIALVLSADTENDTDVLAITGASAALALSEIPFQKTIAGVRVGLVDGQYIINPTFEQRKESKLDLDRRRQQGRPGDGRGRREGSDRRAGRRGARDRARRDQADRRGDRRPREGSRQEEARRSPKKEIGARLLPRGRREGRSCRSPRRCASATSSRTTSRVDQVLEDLVASLPEGEVERKVDAKAIFKELKEKVLRDEVLDARRPARRPQVRRGPRRSGSKPACCRARTARPSSRAARRRRSSPARSAPPTTRRRSRASRARRGSASCSTTTSRRSRSAKSAFMRGPGRREIGHGALAERALAPMMPAEEKFPYTIRIVSDILESNGSSSMASVCGGSLAMMDAGVPIKRAGRRHRDGPRHGREERQVRRPHRHRRRRGSLRRHGLQGRRHRDGHHRAADGHQGQRHHDRDHARRRSSRRAAAGCTSSARWREALPAPRAEHLDVRAAHRHHPDPGRQDPRRHRTRRQDDPQHHRADRREDRRRGRRPRERRVGRRRVGAEGDLDHPGADRRRRS